MAALGMGQISLEFSDGKAERMCVFSFKDVTAGDTADLNGYFKIVKRAVALSSTADHSGSIGTINGTVITIPAGPSRDAVWMMVIGVSV